MQFILWQLRKLKLQISALAQEMLSNKKTFIDSFEFNTEDLKSFGCLQCFLSHFGQDWWHNEMEALLMEGFWCLRLKKNVPSGTWCEASRFNLKP